MNKVEPTFVYESVDEEKHIGKCVCGLTSEPEAHSYSEVVDDKYLASEATCMNVAVYYKSCKCGKMSTETFTYGEKDLTNHVFDQEVEDDQYIAHAADCTHKLTYYKSCVCGACGNTDTFEVGDVYHADLNNDSVCDVCSEPLLEKIVLGQSTTNIEVPYTSYYDATKFS